MILGREPALILAAVQAGIALGLGLGLFQLDGGQVALVMGFAAAIAGVIVRQNVYSQATVDKLTAPAVVTPPDAKPRQP